MNDRYSAGKVIAGILSGIVGVATLAVIFSRGSATANVLSSAFGGFASVLRVAVSPVTGAAAGGSATMGGYSVAPTLGGGSFASGGSTALAGGLINASYSTPALGGLVNSGINIGAKYAASGFSSLFSQNTFNAGAGVPELTAGSVSFDTAALVV